MLKPAEGFADVQVYDITPSHSVGGAARFATKARCMLDCVAGGPAAVHMAPQSHLIFTPVPKQVQDLTAEEPALILFSGAAFNPSLLSTVTKVSWLPAQPEICVTLSWSL